MKLKIFLLTCYPPKTKPISIAIVYKPPTNHSLDYLSRGLNDFNLLENDLFIPGDTNISIINNGENIFDKYKDMSKRKSNFGAVAERYANLYNFRLKTTYETSYDNNMSYLNSY